MSADSNFIRATNQSMYTVLHNEESSTTINSEANASESLKKKSPNLKVCDYLMHIE